MRKSEDANSVGLDAEIESMELEMPAGLEDELAEERTQAGALAKYRKKYINGNCGDELADLLNDLSSEQVLGVCSTLIGEDLNIKYGHLNIGSRVMNSRNRVRGMLRRGEIEIKMVLELVNSIPAER